MFKRRTPHTPLRLIREMFWPSMGWIRALRYVRLRIIRLSDSTHKIAAGLAIGAAISFSPLIGTHFIQAGAIAYFIRANVLSSLIGTFVGNPWTFPFIWWGSIKFGAFLFGVMGLAAGTAIPEHMGFSAFWEIVTSHPLQIFMPWLLGGYLLAVIVWPIAYYSFFQMVKGAKLARKKARLRKVHKVAKEVTGQAK